MNCAISDNKRTCIFFIFDETDQVEYGLIYSIEKMFRNDVFGMHIKSIYFIFKTKNTTRITA